MDCWLHARFCSKCFTNNNALNLCNRWGKGGTERWSNLSKIIVLTRVRAKIRTQAFWLQSLGSWSLLPSHCIRGKDSSPEPLKMKVKVAQSCLTLYNPMDYTVHGILQARIMELVAVPFSRGSSQPRDWTQVSCIAGRFFTNWVIREAQDREQPNLKKYINFKKKLDN